MSAAGGPPVLRVEELGKTFSISGRWRRQPRLLHAVRQVSFTLERGRTLGIVGESGCGKSTLGRMLVGTLTPTAGRIELEGADVLGLRGAAREAALARIQMVFQSPYASLNPRMRIEDIVREPLDVLERQLPKAERRRRTLALLDRVGLPEIMATRFPHELSGGQRQRVGIARALVRACSVVICDEPVASLDVSVQAQVINLLKDLQRELGVSYVFISHDLAIVASMSHDVAVIYLGRIVELGRAEDVLGSPRHPYTQVLIESANIPDPATEKARAPRVLAGDVPNPMAPPSGCPFRTRCWRAEPVCAEQVPPLVDIRETGQRVACHLA
ncbi:ABC transporter ATP-binding protein [Falsiroseomonas ponticola]|uniref:ABC transporter ATP-binding protein n=1 Tax=Falsiroseomonas ponticola TaxID=2786951 RepID=UPI001932CDC5|nr:oligopeptide/dipeptide ABC transporter ATP-binding protein [Roseomonas ponticola]